MTAVLSFCFALLDRRSDWSRSMISFPFRISCAPCVARAQLPSGTVRLVVPYNPGGISDILARGLAHEMGALLGRGVVVENRPGANGSIGATMVARAAPDGLTLLFGVTDTHAVNPAAMRNLQYDAVKDFAPISNVTNVPLALAVGPSRKELTSLAAFIAAAKAKLDAELKSATAALEAQRASSMASLDTEVNKLVSREPRRSSG
jgi:tripartite-type tricarboxylate transporter receptor subunit TctC